MKRLIDRTLFWFEDVERLQSLSESFFSLSTLLNRLLNETYQGQPIKFINIYFLTEETYRVHPKTQKRHVNNFGGHVSYNDVFNLDEFMNLSTSNRLQFIWKRGYEILCHVSREIGNDSLFNSSEYAYRKGLELNLNPDYKLIETNVFLGETLVNASIWINFKNEKMYSKLSLEKNGIVVFEKDIDSAKNGVEFFLEMYKSISADGDSIVIKGRKDVSYLPLKIPIDLNILK